MQEKNVLGEQLVKGLMQAQQRMEQRAFDAINEQDKLLGYIRETIEQIGELGGRYDMFALEVNAAVAQIREIGACEEQTATLECMLECNDELLSHLMKLLNSVLERAEYSSEVIHGMEEEIASSQDAVAAVKEHFETET